jgi:hypothetical protein
VRLSFLALVAANIVFFAWAHWIDVSAKARVAAARDASIPPLQLETTANGGASSAGSATPAQPAAAGSAASAAPAAASSSGAPTEPQAGSSTTASAAPSMRCRSLGPFDDLNAANAVADRLRSRGFSPHERSADTANPNIYWVYIGELTSDMQHHAIQVLNAAGIHDAASMMQPEQSDRVSVGVFADQAHAVRRAEQVRSLGFKPTLGMRQRSVTAHWIDFDLKSSDTEPSTLELTGPATRATIGLGPPKMSDCPATAGSG